MMSYCMLLICRWHTWYEKALAITLVLQTHWLTNRARRPLLLRHVLFPNSLNMGSFWIKHSLPGCYVVLVKTILIIFHLIDGALPFLMIAKRMLIILYYFNVRY